LTISETSKKEDLKTKKNTSRVFGKKEQAEAKKKSPGSGNDHDFREAGGTLKYENHCFDPSSAAGGGNTRERRNVT